MKLAQEPVHSFNTRSLVSKITEKRIASHLKALEGIKHPISAPERLAAGGEYVLTHFNAAGLHPMRDKVKGDCFNVIGQLGKKEEKPILVIGAHYDTVLESFGADDNASGVAALLEVAYALSPLQGDLTVQFVAFTLEESGFVGSRHYVRHIRQNRIPLWGAVILECVGYTNRTPGSQESPPGIPLPDRGDFIGLVGNAQAEPMRKAYEAAALNLNLPCRTLLVPGSGEAFPDTRRSDQVPFWDEGLPAVMLTDTANFRNPNYHWVSDRIDTLDISFTTQVARSVAAAVIDFANLKPVL